MHSQFFSLLRFFINSQLVKKRGESERRLLEIDLAKKNYKGEQNKTKLNSQIKETQ